jgi:acetyl-CoA carboxylase biotin carboxylase subunit
MPGGPGVRVDTAIAAGDRVPPQYDNLIAKVMVHAADRPGAIARLGRALDEVEIGGSQTTLPFHRWLVHDPAFGAGELSTGFVAERWDGAATDLRRTALEAAMQIAASAVTTDAGPGRRGRRMDGRVDGWLSTARADGVDRWPR